MSLTHHDVTLTLTLTPTLTATLTRTPTLGLGEIGLGELGLGKMGRHPLVHHHYQTASARTPHIFHISGEGHSTNKQTSCAHLPWSSHRIQLSHTWVVFHDRHQMELGKHIGMPACIK